ncbi:hypothetical protein HNP24_002802 [Chryseobacterium sediminis]|uniref:Uncharacterized protein n=1 Tax=Chryseobacterium sediminis TaxID=1679494 RepID=A0ABR6Q1L6_9FLAO|nr:hypothetical protein [Chryseobacterium sediminis]
MNCIYFYSNIKKRVITDSLFVYINYEIVLYIMILFLPPFPLHDEAGLYKE